MTYIQGVVKEHGSEILQDAVNKANPDRSFEDPKTVANLDLTKLTDIQKAAYYLDLIQAKHLNEFLGNQYGDNLVATNLTTGEVHGWAGNAAGAKEYADYFVGKDIETRLKTLEDMGVSQVLGSLMNNHVGNWIKENEPMGYAAIQSTFDLALFGFNGKPGTGADKYKDMSLTDAFTSLNTTALLARTYLANDDFVAKAGDLNKTYHDVIFGKLEKTASTMGDFDAVTGKESPAPGFDASTDEYKKWFNSLSENSASRAVQPIVNEAFDQSDIATKLKEAGHQEGSDTWTQYKETYVKDTTTLYNNVWANIRKGVKLDSILKDTYLPDGNSVLKGAPKVAGITADMYRSGLLHTVQNVTLAGALAGAIYAGSGKTSDPQTIMALTYGSTNLADMLIETGVKYLDPKGGGFQLLGLNKDGKWTEKVAKYMPGGSLSKIDAAAKMLVGAGSLVAGASSIWGTVNAIKNKDIPAAVLNTINGAGSVISGLATGAEGVLQWTNVIKNFAGVMYPEFATAIDAAARGVFAALGWGAGLVAGLGLTALGIYDMAKGAKLLDKGLKDAEKYITPTTGWHYKFEPRPDPGFTW